MECSREGEGVVESDRGGGRGVVESDGWGEWWRVMDGGGEWWRVRDGGGEGRRVRDGGGEWWTDGWGRGGEESDEEVRWGWKVREGEGWCRE